MAKAFVQNIWEAGLNHASRLQKCEEVCSAKDEESQPVYTLNELAQDSAGFDEANSIATMLIKKMTSSSNPIIKYKALRAIRFICEKSPAPYFKKACASTGSNPIRALQSYSGPMHPMLGNTLNQRVRESAEAALAEIFRVTSHTQQRPPPATAPNSDLRSRIQGYGSTTGARIQSSSDPNKYTGYGNPEFTDNGGGSDGSSFSAVTPGTGSSRQALRPASEFQAAYRAPGKLTSRHSGESWSTTPANPPTPHLPSANTHDVIGDEASLVRDMCTSGGLRPQPSPDQLCRFVEKVAVLDAYVAAVELTDHLSDEGISWQSKFRALCALCAVADASRVSGAAPPVVTLTGVFHDNPSSIQALCHHAQANVRQQAALCLTALNLSSGASAAADSLGNLLGDDPDTANPTPTQQTRPYDPREDLMSGGPAAPGTGSSAAATNVAGAAVSSGTEWDMFGDFVPPVPAAAFTPAPPTPPMPPTPPLQQRQQAVDAFDMFGDFQGSAPAATAGGLPQSMSQMTPVPAAGSSAGAGAADMFAGLSLHGSTAPPTPPGNVNGSAASAGASDPFGALDLGSFFASPAAGAAAKAAPASDDPFASMLGGLTAPPPMQPAGAQNGDSGANGSGFAAAPAAAGSMPAARPMLDDMFSNTPNTSHPAAASAHGMPSNYNNMPTNMPNNTSYNMPNNTPYSMPNNNTRMMGGMQPQMGGMQPQMGGMQQPQLGGVQQQQQIGAGMYNAPGQFAHMQPQQQVPYGQATMQQQQPQVPYGQATMQQQVPYGQNAMQQQQQVPYGQNAMHAQQAGVAAAAHGGRGMSGMSGMSGVGGRSPTFAQQSGGMQPLPAAYGAQALQSGMLYSQGPGPAGQVSMGLASLGSGGGGPLRGNSVGMGAAAERAPSLPRQKDAFDFVNASMKKR